MLWAVQRPLTVVVGDQLDGGPGLRFQDEPSSVTTWNVWLSRWIGCHMVVLIISTNRIPFADHDRERVAGFGAGDAEACSS